MVIWNDRTFRNLSSDAQLLCFRLLTGPESNPIVGVALVGPEALAEAMGWKTKQFLAAFGELERVGWALADWQERLVWVPEAIRHRGPDNPKQVLGWRDYWPLVPACPLRTIVYRALEAEVVARGGDFEGAFRRVIPSPVGGDTVSPAAVNRIALQERTVPDTGQGSGRGPGRRSGEGEGAPPDHVPDHIPPDSAHNLLHRLKVTIERAHPELGFWTGGDLRDRVAREFFEGIPPADLPRMIPTIEQRVMAFAHDQRAEKKGWTVKAFVDLFDSLGTGANGRDVRVGAVPPESGHPEGEVDL